MFTMKILAYNPINFATLIYWFDFEMNLQDKPILYIIIYNIYRVGTHINKSLFLFGRYLNNIRFDII